MSDPVWYVVVVVLIVVFCAWGHFDLNPQQ